jgi:ABC-type transporter Mla subunit MlaD
MEQLHRQDTQRLYSFLVKILSLSNNTRKLNTFLDTQSLQPHQLLRTPPAPPAEPLAVAEGKGANWVGTDVYEIGQTVEARTAEYAGGVDTSDLQIPFPNKSTRC